MLRWLSKAVQPPCLVTALLAAASVFGLAIEARAQFRDLDWDYVITTPDIETEIHGTRATDRTPMWGRPGTPFASPIDLGPLAEGVAIDAHDRVYSGRELFSVEEPTALPGGLEVQAADVVVWDGRRYALAFDASSFDLPSSANVDAVSRDRFGPELYLSFDATVQVGGVTAQDEDLVRWDGASGFSLFFDGSDVGVDPALDVDGADYVEGDEGDWIVVSLDGDGEVPFDLFDSSPYLLQFKESDVILFDVQERQWDFVDEPAFANAAADSQTVSAMTVPEPGGAPALAAAILLLNRLGCRRPLLVA